MALNWQSVIGTVGDVAGDVVALDKWWDGVSGTPSPVPELSLPQGTPVPPGPKKAVPEPTPSTVAKSSSSNTALLVVAAVVGLVLYLR